MQTVTFTCPHCTNLMAVGQDHLGLQVRCPTCQGVVIAPTSAPAAAIIAPPPPPTPELSIESGPEEPHESIFGENPDDDLFGSRPPTVEMPVESAPVFVTPPSQFASYPPAENLPAFELPPADPPVTAPIMSEPAAPWYSSASAPEAPPTTPPTPVTNAEPWYAAATPAPPPSEPKPTAENWFAAASMPADSVPAEAASASRTEPAWSPDEGTSARIQARAPQESLERRRGSNLLTTILAPYAVVMTLVAIYYFYKYSNYSADNDPLAKIGDLGRVDLPRRKDGSQTYKLPKVDEPLSRKLRVKLGSTLTVGDLEVTPLRVEQGRFKVYNVLKNDQVETITTGKEAMILHLRVKNLSSEWCFSPTDPLFDRRYDPQFHSAQPYTFLQIGNEQYFGGPLEQLRLEARVKRIYFEGRENEEKLLNPGEERLITTCSDPRNDAILAAAARAKDPITWRVHLRRGVERYKGHDYSVTSVIGVEFSASDIKRVARH